MFGESLGQFKAHLIGSAVREGRIDVEDLLVFVSYLKTAIERVAIVLSGAQASLTRGRRPQEIKRQCRLQFLGFEPGSVQLSFGLATPTQLPFPFYDNLGEHAVRTLLEGLSAFKETNDSMPLGYDMGVLHAWIGVGKIFSRGIDCVTFTLLGTEAPISYDFDPQVFEKIEGKIRCPIQGQETLVEGRLLMADFKESNTRCRIHPPAGEPIMCSFDDEIRDDVLAALTKHVRARGKATLDAITGRIMDLDLSGVEIIEDDEAESMGFWTVEPVESLARAQGSPLSPRFDDLKGHFWPEDETVEEFIEFVRHLK